MVLEESPGESRTRNTAPNKRRADKEIVKEKVMLSRPAESGCH